MGSPTSETVGLVAGDEESFEVCYLVCRCLKINQVIGSGIAGDIVDVLFEARYALDSMSSMLWYL